MTAKEAAERVGRIREEIGAAEASMAAAVDAQEWLDGAAAAEALGERTDGACAREMRDLAASGDKARGMKAGLEARLPEALKDFRAVRVAEIRRKQAEARAACDALADQVRDAEGELRQLTRRYEAAGTRAQQLSSRATLLERATPEALDVEMAGLLAAALAAALAE